MDGRGAGIEHRLAEADPVDNRANLALHEEVLDHEDVHLSGLSNGRHVFEHGEVMLHCFDGDVRIHNPFGLGFGSGRLIPDRAAILPDECIRLHGREVVAFAGLIGDAVP